ncbi:MAG: single-stranded-DNA-specific exonuclease RecJ [Christensenellales bacterium]|jgi:single-stranded-DNA-specific exonuclease
MQQFVRRGEDRAISGYPPWLASLLWTRGVTTPEAAAAFLSPSLDDLHDPMLLSGMEAAKSLILDVAGASGRAVVYGDYDVDGLCASVMVSETLRSLGIKTIVYIPDRHSEGYGLNMEAVRALAPQADLMVTVDCGITSVDEVKAAKALGMRVIVTDHHTPPDALPPADAVVNPLLGGYPFPHLCGAGVAWKLCQALKGAGHAGKYLDLAALATIADMVPLTGENRVLAAHGLKALAQTGRPGLKALMAVVGMEPGAPVSGDRVAFGLAPRLNAGGRVDTARDALRLLETDNPHEARDLAERLNALNSERRCQQDALLREAERLLDEEDLLHRRVIVLKGQGWNSGIVGLVAGKLAEAYAYPAVVLAEEGDLCVGSARSVDGIDLYRALESCAEVLVRFGGHRQAAGLTLKTADVPAFSRLFDEAVRQQAGDGPLTGRVYYDDVIGLDDVTVPMAEQLERLAPFGVGNPAPQFLAEQVDVRSARAVGEGRHLKMRVAAGESERDAIFFGEGSLAEALPPEIRMVFQPQVNAFRGEVTAQCVVRAVGAGRLAFRADAQGEALALLQDLKACASYRTAGGLSERSMDEPAPPAPQGVLLLCRAHDTAQRLHEAYPALHKQTARLRDRKAHSAVLYRAPLQHVSGPYTTVVFCDGVLHEAELALAAGLFPGARVCARLQTAALQALHAGICLTTDELRAAYVAIRSQPGGLFSLGWGWAKALAAAWVLEELRLIQLTDDDPYTARLMDLRKCDPLESRLFRLLNR